MTEKLTERDYEVLDACCELLSIKIDELKAENDRLIEEIKKVKKYQYQQEYLDKEIERLKAEFKIESLTDKTTGETIYRSNLVNKYRIILQEIKAIAERAFAVCEDDCGNANKFKKIIELTKAEEE